MPIRATAGRRMATRRAAASRGLPEEYDLLVESRRDVRAGTRPPNDQPSRRASAAPLVEPPPARWATTAPRRPTPSSSPRRRALRQVALPRPAVRLQGGEDPEHRLSDVDYAATASPTSRAALRSTTSVGGAVLSHRHRPRVLVRRRLPRRGAQRDQLHDGDARHRGGLRRGRDARRLRAGADRLARPRLPHRRAARGRQQRVRRELRPRVLPEGRR